MNRRVHLLAGKETGTSWLNYLNSFLNSRPGVFPAARRPMRLAIFPFFTVRRDQTFILDVLAPVEPKRNSFISR